MEIKITKKLGNSVIEFRSDRDKLEDAMLELDAFMKKDICSCGSEDISFDTRKVNAKDGSGTYVYVKRRCNKCNKTSTLGKLKDGSGYFWKEWELYQRDYDQNDNQAQHPENEKDDVKLSDIPF